MKTILHLIEKAGGYRREFYLRIENFVDDTDRSGAFPQCRVLDFLV